MLARSLLCSKNKKYIIIEFQEMKKRERERESDREKIIFYVCVFWVYNIFYIIIININWHFISIATSAFARHTTTTINTALFFFLFIIIYTCNIILSFLSS